MRLTLLVSVSGCLGTFFGALVTLGMIIDKSKQPVAVHAIKID